MKDIYIEQSLKSHILRDALREAITDSEFAPGDRFPSENELIARYHVSRGTVREAITSLVQEGLLNRTQGKGTFVSVIKRKPKTIALIVPHLRYPGVKTFAFGFDITPSLVHAIEDEAKKRGAQILLYLSNNDPEIELYNYECIIDHNPDAAIILYTGNLDVVNQLHKLKEQNVPFVLMDKYVADCDFDYVGTNNLTGAYDTVKQLIDYGYRDIYHITYDFPITSVRDRKLGYLKAMRENNLPDHIIDVNQVNPIVNEFEMTYLSIQKLLKNVSLPFAFFSVNAPILEGCMKAIADAGIPEDQFALATVDEPFGPISDNTLIVKMIQPVEQTGSKAVQIVMDKLNGNCQHNHIEYPAEIQISGSKA